MKQITLVLSILLAYSQMNAQRITYGFQGGANFAVQSPIGDIYHNDDIKTGFNVGAFGNYSFNKVFSLQTELNYVQNGSQNEIAKNSYNYISIPVLANYCIPQKADVKWQINLFAGPNVSFLLKAEQKLSDNETSNMDLIDNTNNTEMGIVYGFSVKHPIQNHSVIFNFRFGLGLTPYDVNDSDPKNKYTGIGIGYEF